MRHGLCKLTEQQELEIIQRYDNGESTRQIAADYPVGKSTIQSILNRNNVSMRSVGNPLTLTPGNPHSCGGSYKRKYALDEGFFSSIDTPEKAYWLGFISADGHVGNDGITIGLQKADDEHLHKFLYAVQSNSPVTYPANAARVNVYSQRMVEDLRKMGFYRNKSQTQTMPDIPIHLHSHFIRGLFDGDGSLKIYTRNKKRYVNPVTEYTIALAGTAEMVSALRDIIVNACGVSEVKIQSRGTLHILEWSGKQQVQRILNWMYADANVYLQRKYERAMGVV